MPPIITKGDGLVEVELGPTYGTKARAAANHHAPEDISPARAGQAAVIVDIPEPRLQAAYD